MIKQPCKFYYKVSVYNNYNKTTSKIIIQNAMLVSVEVIYTLGKNNSICQVRLSLICILAFWYVSLESGLAGTDHFTHACQAN